MKRMIKPFNIEKREYLINASTQKSTFYIAATNELHIFLIKNSIKKKFNFCFKYKVMNQKIEH